MNLEIGDTGALNGLLHTLDYARNDKCALGADVATELDHLLAQLLAGRNNSLHSVEVLSQVQESEFRRLNPCILHPASECDLLVLIAGDIGKLGAWSSRRLVFFGANEGKFAVCAYRDVGGIVGLLLGTLSKFAGFGCSFLLCLGYREHYELERKGILLTFSFSFCAFFSAFLEGGSAPVGAASLIVVVLGISSRVVQWSVVSCGRLTFP